MTLTKAGNGYAAQAPTAVPSKRCLLDGLAGGHTSPAVRPL